MRTTIRGMPNYRDGRLEWHSFFHPGTTLDATAADDGHR